MMQMDRVTRLVFVVVRSKFLRRFAFENESILLLLHNRVFTFVRIAIHVSLLMPFNSGMGILLQLSR